MITLPIRIASEVFWSSSISLRIENGLMSVISQNARRKSTMPTPAKASDCTRALMRESGMSLASVEAGIPEMERAVAAGRAALIGGDGQALARPADLHAERRLGGPSGEQGTAEDEIHDHCARETFHGVRPSRDEWDQRRDSNDARRTAKRSPPATIAPSTMAMSRTRRMPWLTVTSICAGEVQRDHWPSSRSA